MTTQQELTKFLEDSFKYPEGTFYTPIDDYLYVVTTQDDNNERLVKIAYNCDDLQCDYDYDWYFPQANEDDCYIYETSYTQEDDLSLLASDILSYYESIKGEYKK